MCARVHLSYSGRLVVGHTVVLFCIFLVINEAEYLFICLVKFGHDGKEPSNLCSLLKFSYLPFACCFVKVLCISGYKSSVTLSVWQIIFTEPVACVPFHFLNGIFWQTEVLLFF